MRGRRGYVRQLSVQPEIYGIVVKAARIGAAGYTEHTVIYVYDGLARNNDISELLLHGAFDVGDMGEQRIMVGAPLDGYLITAHGVDTDTREVQSLASPHRYSVAVYRLDARHGRVFGYLPVLQYISADYYQAENHEVIDHEIPAVRRLLKAVYPAGAPE